MLHWILSLLFPVRSAGGKEGEWITAEELESIKTLPLCLETHALRSRGVLHLDCLVAAASYESSAILRTDLHRFKYRGVRAIGAVLGEVLAGTAQYVMRTEGSVLCPVPLHWTRHFARGFNQSEILAQHVSLRTGIKMVQCLRRSHATGRQAKRTRDERIAAMKNIFRVTQKIPAHVILIDDVATTCSTLDACAAALKQAGALKVSALVVALADDTLAPSFVGRDNAR